MDERAVEREELLAGLPPLPAGDLPEELRTLIREVGRKVIVLDDDPTGTQTVHDIPVVTRWSVDHLARELVDESPASYVLTNSRSLTTTDAVELNQEIGRNLRQASARTGREFVVVSRSDSTLRGHFPEEPEALAAGLGRSFDACVLCPFFEEGGRLTINDVHYVAEGERLVPAAQTPFAADAAFGFRSSNLREWVTEKSGGTIGPDRITSLTIDELRGDDPRALRRKLADMPAGSVCVINAVSRRDMQAAMLGLLQAEAAGRQFLYRTAASFVAVRSGIDPRPCLEGAELTANGGSGVLIVVGSYVPKTTAQVQHLIDRDACALLELDVRRVLDGATYGNAVAEIAARATERLAADHAVMVYTSREIISDSHQHGLTSGRTISRALVDIVRAVSVRPHVLIAKGGITSSDLATKACEVERAIVLGQILPGIPVWKCGPESRWPEMPLVVFPGNVGEEDGLTEVLARVRGSRTDTQSERRSGNRVPAG